MRLAAAIKHAYHYVQLVTCSGFGGPKREDRTNPNYLATPTREGRFTIVSIGPHATTKIGEGIREWSAVAWGTPLRLDQKGIVQIKLLRKDWQQLASLPLRRHLGYDQAFAVEAIKNRNLLLWKPVLGAYAQAHQTTPAQLYRKILNTWVFNDFGHVAIKHYRDVDYNGCQDLTEAERTLSDFIYTTPGHKLFEHLVQQVKAGLSCALTVLHGCVHTFLAAVNTMIRAGCLRVGGPFVVHSYTARPKVIFDETSSELRTVVYEMPFFSVRA